MANDKSKMENGIYRINISNTRADDHFIDTMSNRT